MKFPLWCDVPPSRKRKLNESSSRKENGDDVDSIYQALLDKHNDAYDKPQLKLWARMLHCGSHTDYDNPPRVPLITGTAPKRRKSDFSETFRNIAAEAVAKAISPPPPATTTTGDNTSSETETNSIGISPGKTVELRSKNLQQLRYIQQLYEDNILSPEEFAEQKGMILQAIRKLNKN